MAGTVFDFYQTKGSEYLEAALVGIVGRSSEYAVEESLFRKHVIERGWTALPERQRQAGRQKLHWDELLLNLRRDVYNIEGGRLVFRADARTRITQVLSQTLAADRGRRPTPAPAAVAVAAQPAPSTTAPRPAATITIPAAVSRPTPTAPVLGIDLGSTFARAAFLDAQGRPVSVSGAAGDVLTPSVVLFQTDNVLAGREALASAATAPQRIAEQFKRDLGGKSYHQPVNGWDLPPEAIAAFVLRGVKADAEQKLGPVKKAVLAVPAKFDERRRRAVRIAAQLVDLEVLDLVSEPTAAALAYAHQHGLLDRQVRWPGERPFRLLTYDLGGGMFAVTVIEIAGHSFKAIATDGDLALGGRDWDERLAAVAADRIARETGVDPRRDPANRQELLLSAEAAKRTLSERAKAALVVNHAGWRLKADVSRQEFENATAPLLARTRQLAEGVVQQARLTWPEIDRVLLIGGATRMPMVARLIEELTGLPPDRTVSADEAVAHGAALYGGMLQRRQQAGGPPRFTVSGLSLHSLGIIGVDARTAQRRNQVLIPRGTQLPCTVTMTCRTARSNQRRITVWLVEGESERLEDCFPVGTCTIGDLPANLPAGWPVAVSYTYEANRQVQLQAKVEGQAAAVPASFQRDPTPPADAVNRWHEYLARDGNRRPQ